MNSYYNPEFKPLLETAQRFATREITGKVVKLDSLEKPGFPWEAIRVAGEAGFLCGPMSEDIGGGALSLEALTVLIEKIAEGAAGPATIFATHLAVVRALAGVESAKPLLKRMAEQSADPQPFLFGASLPMTAVPLNRPAIPEVEESKGDIVITGDFICFPSPEVCRHVVLVTGEKDAHSICVDAAKMSPHGSAVFPGSGLEEFTASGLRLDEFRATDDEIMDKTISAQLRRNLRVLLAAAQLGNARAALRTAWQYAEERVQTGRKIIEHQEVRRILETMAEQADAMTGMVRLAACAPEDKIGWDLARRAYTFCGSAAEQVCLDAVQTLGGYGYMKDYGVEKRVRDAKSLQCLLGTYVEGILGGA